MGLQETIQAVMQIGRATIPQRCDAILYSDASIRLPHQWAQPISRLVSLVSMDMSSNRRWRDDMSPSRGLAGPALGCISWQGRRITGLPSLHLHARTQPTRFHCCDLHNITASNGMGAHRNRDVSRMNSGGRFFAPNASSRFLQM